MKESLFAVILALCVGSLVMSEKSVELLKPGDEVELKCQLDPPVQWFKDSTIVSSGTHHLVNHDNGTLTIFKVLTSDLAGVYHCNNSQSSSKVTLNAGAVAKKFPDRSLSLVQGDELELKCGAWGYPPPTVTWWRSSSNGSDVELTNSTRITLNDVDNVRGAMLTIVNMTLEDYGHYTCKADNGFRYSGEKSSVNTVSILVRVKDKMTPLWPFIGIIVEIITLITIIIVYEKRKSKDSDSDDTKDIVPVANSNDHKHDDDDNVRSRK